MQTVLDDAEISDLNFSPEELGLLREAGLLGETRLTTPWTPETLEDVDWLGWKLRQLADEAQAIAERAQQRIETLNRSRAVLLERYGADCQRIVTENLPRNRQGKVTRKSLTLDRVKASLRTVGGGMQLDEVEFLAHVTELHTCGALPEELAAAVRVTEETSGPDAVTKLRTEGNYKVSILKTPVAKYLASLPSTPDPEAGEALPSSIPGVTLADPVDRLYFE